MNGRIFVHIAAYRDPELVPTIIDCVINASNPNRLRFGVVWQHAPEENAAALSILNNVRILKIPHTESKGACWARAQGQTLYDGEEFYLQLDSHHRFAKGWDDLLIDMLTGLERDGIRKPVITGYTPEYHPDTDPVGRATEPLTIAFKTFSDQIITPSTEVAKGGARLSKPFRARFLAAGLIFARGAFVAEVPYDPNLYFSGEELNLGVRAFTHGWELFHPHKLVLWHYYIREGKTKHWTDHNITKVNDASLARLKTLLSIDGHSYADVDWQNLGLGKERTLRQWEHYTGVCLSLKRITPDCIDGLDPVPNWDQPIDDAAWEASLVAGYEHVLEVTSGHFTHDDYDYIYVGFDAKDGSNIHGMNISGSELKRLTAKQDNRETILPIKTSFFSKQSPHRWIFWPHSKSAGWTQRLSGLVPTTK